MEFSAHQDSPGDIPGETIEASKRALERTEAIVHAELKRGLGGLATIGSTAPFVGRFGTVMGILNAFKGIRRRRLPVWPQLLAVFRRSAGDDRYSVCWSLSRP